MKLSDLSRDFLSLKPGKSITVKGPTERNRIVGLSRRRGIKYSSARLIRGGFRMWREA